MEGPMGVQRTAVLKLVALEGDTRLAEELAREATITARLSHAAIVRMFDFFEEDGHLVLVLEHTVGTNLDRLKQLLGEDRKHLGDDAIGYLGMRIAGALAHAHGAADEEGAQTPVLHRDLRPENVLVGWDGEVRLAGFGLGKILGRTPDTIAGVVKGTPGYMAPEQARGERVTPRADVYGLGVLLWSLYARRHPPIDGSRPAPLSKLREDLPREISAAIEAALEPDVNRRRITCLEIEQWLEKIAKVDIGKMELREVAQRVRETEPKIVEPERPRVPLQHVRKSEPPPPSSRAEPLVRTRQASATARARGPRGRRAGGGMGSAYPPENTSGSYAGPLPEAPPGATGTATEGSFAGQLPLAPPPAPTFGTPPPLPPLSEHPLADTSPRSVAPEAGYVEGRMRGRPDPIEPGPRAQPRARPRRPLSALETVGVATLSAVVVVALGIFIAERGLRGPAPAGSAPIVVVVPQPPQVVMQPTATAAASAAATAAPAITDPAQLPPDTGLLTVTSPVEATVYMNGSAVGPTNQPLKVLCGRWFVRIGTPPESGTPTWMANGASVAIGCQRATKIDAHPAARWLPKPK
jgi:serine/threonine-protein kinase